MRRQPFAERHPSIVQERALRDQCRAIHLRTELRAGGKDRQANESPILVARASQAEIEAAVQRLNDDPACTGFIVQLPLGLLGLFGTIGGNDDFLGTVVKRTVGNPLHPDDIVSTSQVILDGNVRNGHATIVWR